MAISRGKQINVEIITLFTIINGKLRFHSGFRAELVPSSRKINAERRALMKKEIQVSILLSIILSKCLQQVKILIQLRKLKCRIEVMTLLTPIIFPLNDKHFSHFLINNYVHLVFVGIKIKHHRNSIPSYCFILTHSFHVIHFA